MTTAINMSARGQKESGYGFMGAGLRTEDFNGWSRWRNVNKYGYMGVMD